METGNGWRMRSRVKCSKKPACGVRRGIDSKFSNGSCADADGRAEYHYVLVDFVCKVVEGSLRAGDDVSRAQWVKHGDIGEYRLTPGTLEVIEKAFHARRNRS